MRVLHESTFVNLSLSVNLNTRTNQFSTIIYKSNLPRPIYFLSTNRLFLDCGSSLASEAFDMFPQGQRAVSIIKCQRFMGSFTSSSHWQCYSHMLLKKETFPKSQISPVEDSWCCFLHWFSLLFYIKTTFTLKPLNWLKKNSQTPDRD